MIASPPQCRLLCLFFFFSSRRRHTRSLCDWSSDVCSSDLRPNGRDYPCPHNLATEIIYLCRLLGVSMGLYDFAGRLIWKHHVCVPRSISEIGRASCRERV